MLLSGTYARESGAMYARGHQKWAHVSKASQRLTAYLSHNYEQQIRMATTANGSCVASHVDW